MKKKTIAFLSTLLALALCLCSMGCGGTTYLSFKNNFVGGVEHSAVPPSYEETLTYEVNYAEKYHADYIIKSKDLDENVINFQFETGLFVQTFSILDRLPLDIQTDIDTTNSKIYRLTSTFNLSVKYALNGESLDNATYHNDTVETTTYFLPAGLSLAPIYSSTYSSGTYVILSGTTAELKSSVTSVTTKYNKTSYEMTVKHDDKLPTTTTYPYTTRTVIDNAQLFFAIRNMSLDTQMATLLPTVSYSYGVAKDLSVRVHGNLTEEVNISFTENGLTTVETNEIKYEHVSFMLSSSTNSGAPQYLKMQTESSTALPYKRLVLEYAETLTTFGSFKSMGALIYTLKSVEIK